jgi:ABC-type branched-subunit amino acid transport system ATPase component/ABC-type branched-subunit amino acid transport system permease subunit
LLSGVAVLLRVPLAGGGAFSSITGSGTSLLVRTLAAAVLARMDNIAVAAGAAVGLGVLESVGAWNLGNTTYVDALLVIVILAALLAQRGGFSRQEESALAATRFRAIREVRPIPAELRRLREVRAGRALLLATAVGLGVLFPVVASPSRQQLGTVILIYAVVAVSLVVLTGWAGQISLGHWALVGLGGAATSALHVSRGLDLFLAVPAGMLVAAGVSVLLGLPALRVRGPFLAVSTLAFALTASTYLLQDRHFPWLVVDDVPRPVLWGRLFLDRDWQMYYLALVAFLAVVAAAAVLRRSRTGGAMIAVRDNEAAAASLSISPVQVKLAAFAFSGAMAGLAGALYVLYQRGFHSDAFVPEASLRLFSMVVIGGLGSLGGAVLGAVYVRGAEFFLPAGWSLMASGAGIVALLVVLPGGLGEMLYRLRDASLRRVAARHGIAVPSLSGSEDRAAVPPGPEPELAPDSTGTALLDVRGLNVDYDGVQVLFGVDLRVADGEVVALLGTNGAGKSTMLRAVSGLLRPSAGSVTFAGEAITGWSPGRVAAIGITQMPGGRSVFPTLSVAENLAVAGWLRRDDPALAADVETALDSFPVLRQRSATPAGALSGGEQQMLGLAMAFVTRPRLLLIDELALGLSPAVVDALVGMVRTMAEAGTTVIIVEQRVTTALRLAARAVFLEKGTVRFSGPTADLLARPDILHSIYLQGARVVAQPRREVSGTESVAPPAEPRPALTLRGVRKRYGGITAVDDVHLEIFPGEIVGLIGPNGAGKTTLFDVIAGLTPADAGSVSLDGTDVSAWSAPTRARAGLGRSFQDARLWPSLTVEHALAVAFERHRQYRASIPAMLRLPASVDEEAAIAGEVDALIDTLGLEPFRNKFVAELSTGTRRIVEMGTLLAHRPSVLLLDEPSGGIAQQETEALVPLLLDVRSQLDCTLVVIDHDTTLLSGVAERFVALHTGRVIADGPPAEVLDDPVVANAFLGNTARDSVAPHV